MLPASAKCRLNCLCLCLTVTECPSGCLVNDPIPKADSLLWSIFDHDGNTRLEACCSHKLVQFSLLAYFFFFSLFFWTNQHWTLLTRGEVMWFHIYERPESWKRHDKDKRSRKEVCAVVKGLNWLQSSDETQDISRSLFGSQGARDQNFRSHTYGK